MYALCLGCFKQILHFWTFKGSEMKKTLSSNPKVEFWKSDEQNRSYGQTLKPSVLEKGVWKVCTYMYPWQKVIILRFLHEKYLKMVSNFGQCPCMVTHFCLTGPPGSLPKRLYIFTPSGIIIAMSVRRSSIHRPSGVHMYIFNCL